LRKRKDGNPKSLDPELLDEYKSFIRQIGALDQDGAYDQAITLVLRKLKDAERLDFIQPEVDLRNHLGILHWKNNAFETFLEETASALALARVHNYKRGVAEALLNLAWVLAMERKDFMKAFDFTEEALGITEEIGYVKGMATSMYIIATAYKFKKMQKKADYYLERSLQLSMSLAEETDLLMPTQLSEEEKDQLKGALDLL
jgi:tetratricopeptide (TPR) repeat protein